MSGSDFFKWRERVWGSPLLFATIATALRVGAQFLLLPAILIALSPTDQAMWWVFVALGNTANLVDFGFGQAITRAYNYLWAGAADIETEGLQPPVENKEPNLQRIALFHHTVRHLYQRLALLALSLLAVGGTLYLYQAVSQTGYATKVWTVWFFYLIAIALNFGTSYWMLACQGINRVREMHIAYLSSSVAYLVTVLFLLRLGGGLAAMVAGTFARGLVLRQMGRATFYGTVPRLEQRGEPDLSVVQRLWPNAKRFGLLSLTGYLQANFPVLLSRYFLGVETTAAVGLTSQAGSFVSSCASLWLGVKWPQITILRTQGRTEEMSVLFARRLGLAVVSFLVMAALVLVTGNAFLEWKHTATRLIPLPYLIVYLLYLLQQLVYLQFALLVFTTNVVPFVRVSLLTGLAMIVLSLVLTPRWGLWGLILSPLIAELAISAWVVVLRGFKVQSLGPGSFFRAAVLGRLQ